jgi:hypothetical protein
MDPLVRRYTISRRARSGRRAHSRRTGIGATQGDKIVTLELTDRELKIIADARELAAVRAEALREYSGQADIDRAREVTLGRAQLLLTDLAGIIERLREQGSRQ